MKQNFDQFNGSSSNSEAAKWDMSGVSFAGNEAPTKRTEAINVEPDGRQHQYRKLLAYFLSGDLNAINLPDAKVNQNDAWRVYESMATGRIGKTEEKKVLQSIAGPRHQYTPQQVLVGIAADSTGTERRIPGIGNDKHMRRILAHLTGTGFSHPEQVAEENVADFWRRYETPADFEDDAAEFLSTIKQYNSADKYKEYTESMQNFKNVMFGKQQEYWDQIKRMEKDAQNYKNVFMEEPRK